MTYPFHRHGAVALFILTLPMLSCAQDAGKETETDGAKAKHSNQLIHETSPYLLQHAHNPVNWYPWGDEAFERAKREDKPIFLSVGYSTCYWCHVMEKESFETPEVADILNEHYVAIKVDREERPDVDEQYMLATQMVTGRGGWPNSVWLTPDGRPWMAGTYFPKPQFMQILSNLIDVWKQRRDDVEAQATQLAESIRQVSGSPGGEVREPSTELVSRAATQLAARFDEANAGFGSAPKFPPHGTLRLLLGWSRIPEAGGPPDPVTRTLDAMWWGGLHDHVGGGFHRYSTDAEWLLPHFEKMLYDNAQLLRIYAEVAALTGEPRYRRAVDDIHRWLKREMTHPGGAFYSAIDSGEVGEEGAFYLWTIDELEEVLGEEDARFFAEVYGFEARGNFREESTRQRTGENIPHLDQSISGISEAYGIAEDDLRESLAAMRTQLLEARQERPFPHKDDKILTSWNGLMIEALAYAGAELDAPHYMETAVRAADFILENMWTGVGLLRSYRERRAHQPGFLDDHAYFAAALLRLHAATGDKRWLDAARKLGNTLLEDFQDTTNGGFFLVPEGADSVIARSKALSGGGNLPSANGVAAQALLELSEQTGNTRYAQAAAATLDALAGLASSSPFAQEHVLLAMLHQFHPASFGQAAKVSGGAESGPSEEVGGDEVDAGAWSKADKPAVVSVSHRTDPVNFIVSAPKGRYAPGETIQLSLELQIDEGWHLYGENPELDFLVPVAVNPVPLPDIAPGPVRVPEPREKRDPILDKMVYTYEGTIHFTVSLKIRSDATPGPTVLTLKALTQACDAMRCLPPETTSLRLPVEITPSF